MLLLAPTVASACVIPIRRIGPINMSPTELRRPVVREVSRSVWGLDTSHISTKPRLSQFVVVRGWGTAHGATYRRQQALSIDAIGPDTNRWLYFSDEDPNTPPCELAGKTEFLPPVIRAVQSAKEVRVAATTQRTPGNRDGCILGPDFGVAECPNLTRIILRLRAPIGDRPLVFEVFA